MPCGYKLGFNDRTVLEQSLRLHCLFMPQEISLLAVTWKSQIYQLTSDQQTHTQTDGRVTCLYANFCLKFPEQVS